MFSMYQFLRDNKQREEVVTTLAKPLSEKFTDKDLTEVPGLKDVAFYYLILNMMKGQLINRLYTHALEWLLYGIREYNEIDGITENSHLDKAVGRLKM